MKAEELRNKSYDELVQLCQSGKITQVEFIETQPELTDAWDEWIDTNPINEQSTMVFLRNYEAKIMD